MTLLRRATWTGHDGGDSVSSFVVGKDRLVLVDIDSTSPITSATSLIATSSQFQISSQTDVDGNYSQIAFRFGRDGDDNRLVVNFEEGDRPDGSLTDLVEIFGGEEFFFVASADSVPLTDLLVIV